jgi:tetratricopeptide (TPR) repeat protein
LFKKVIELEPAYGQAYYSLGLLFAEQNKMLEAVDYLKQATEKIDYNDRVPYNYGLILQRLGKRDEAESAFKKGLKINPNSTPNLYALGYLYVEQNRFNEASPVLIRLLQLDPSNQQYQQLNNAVQQGLQ